MELLLAVTRCLMQTNEQAQKGVHQKKYNCMQILYEIENFVARELEDL